MGLKSRTVFVALATALVFGDVAQAEDVLYSSRLTKRSLADHHDDHVNISFFHVNDVHSHLDQYAPSGTDCKDPSKGCIGGYARIKTKVDELRDGHPDHLWLNAGDEFQGTLFYTYYGGAKIAETLNELRFDAMTLGNHEWDGGDEKLGDFLGDLAFPVTACNVKSGYPGLNGTVRDYVLFEDKGLAIIGASTPTTPLISHVGNLTTFLDPVEQVQRAIYEIRNTTNIRRIVALTHIGYEVDQRLAAGTEGLSLIVGGHSHTLVGDMPGAEGKYPTVVRDLSGSEVFVVTSYRWGEYLGSIDVTLGADGKALAYRGAPIHLDGSVPQDPELQAKIARWREPFDKFANQVIGSTKHALDISTCQVGDCLLGEVMADAMLEYAQSLANSTAAEPPSLAILNAGGARATLEAGNITRGEVLTAFPFGNTVTVVDIPGADLRRVFEGAVSKVSQFNGQPVEKGIQVSSTVRLAFDPRAPPGRQLQALTVAGDALDGGRTYRVAVSDFVAGGGDNILPAKADFVALDTLDEVLTRYIQEHTPLTNALEERMVAVGEGGLSKASVGNQIVL